MSDDKTRSADDLVAKLESEGLGWDVGRAGPLIEARVWRWPYVIGRYRPKEMKSLYEMLSCAMRDAGINVPCDRQLT